MGLLLPALSGARKEAAALKCASNLRQIALGWALYANGSGGVTLQDLGYVVNSDGSVPATGPGTHNKFFPGTARDDDPPRINQADHEWGRPAMKER